MDNKEGINMSPVNKMLTDIKGEIDSNVIVGDTLLTLWTDHLDRKSIRNWPSMTHETRWASIYIDKIFYPTPEEYTFYSNAHGIFPRIDIMLGHKRKLNQFKKIESISSNFSDHNAMKLEINYKKKAAK